MKSTIAIIPAAGTGNRMGFDKITSKLNDIPLLVRTIRAVSAAESVSGIILAVSPDIIDEIKKNIVDKYKLYKVMKIVPGGNTRTESVWNALQSIEVPPDIIAIHDGARPFVSVKAIEESIKIAAEFGGAIVATKVIPTIKEVNSENEICGTIDRDKLWAAATPQTFRYEVFFAAYKEFLSSNIDRNSITDDAQIFELSGRKVKIVEGNPENIKLTTPFDWNMGEFIVKKLFCEKFDV